MGSYLSKQEPDKSLNAPKLLPSPTPTPYRPPRSASPTPDPRPPMSKLTKSTSYPELPKIEDLEKVCYAIEAASWFVDLRISARFVGDRSCLLKPIRIIDGHRPFKVYFDTSSYVVNMSSDYVAEKVVAGQVQGCKIEVVNGSFNGTKVYKEGKMLVLVNSGNEMTDKDVELKTHFKAVDSCGRICSVEMPFKGCVQLEKSQLYITKKGVFCLDKDQVESVRIVKTKPNGPQSLGYLTPFSKEVQSICCTETQNKVLILTEDGVINMTKSTYSSGIWTVDSSFIIPDSMSSTCIFTTILQIDFEDIEHRTKIVTAGYDVEQRRNILVSFRGDLTKIETLALPKVDFSSIAGLGSWIHLDHKNRNLIFCWLRTSIIIVGVSVSVTKEEFKPMSVFGHVSLSHHHQIFGINGRCSNTQKQDLMLVAYGKSRQKGMIVEIKLNLIETEPTRYFFSKNPKSSHETKSKESEAGNNKNIRWLSSDISNFDMVNLH